MILKRGNAGEMGGTGDSCTCRNVPFQNRAKACAAALLSASSDSYLTIRGLKKKVVTYGLGQGDSALRLLTSNRHSAKTKSLNNGTLAALIPQHFSWQCCQDEREIKTTKYLETSLNLQTTFEIK